MRPIYSLLSLLLVLIGISVWILLIPEPVNGHGIPHPVFAGMKQAGDAWQQTENVFLIAYVLGCVIYLIVSALIYNGIPQKNRDRSHLIWHLLATLVVLAMWTCLIVVYHQFLNSDDPMIVFGFPLPTLIMLFGVWLAPFCFTLIYVIGFRRWIFTEEDEEKFMEMLKGKST